MVRGRPSAANAAADVEAELEVRETRPSGQADEMAELAEQLAVESARLEELRGLQRRMELRQLELSDVPKLEALLTQVIAEIEAAGLDGIDLEVDLPDQEQPD
ncbi:MAG: hypothetical protein HC834_05165 [Rhodospirillales bacterium]|nr:hypothetical protein [Rhodospirillales bacterium]